MFNKAGKEIYENGENKKGLAKEESAWREKIKLKNQVETRCGSG
jgi:hypothetical protein